MLPRKCIREIGEIHFEVHRAAEGSDRAHQLEAGRIFGVDARVQRELEVAIESVAVRVTSKFTEFDMKQFA